MAVTAQFLKGIMAEARPIIERQMNDAAIIAGLRTVVANAGGDWGALKALIKAHVEDENDETGAGKRVQKIRDKADSTSAYADMLGLANMNEENFSAETGEITEQPETAHQFPAPTHKTAGFTSRDMGGEGANTGGEHDCLTPALNEKELVLTNDQANLRDGADASVRAVETGSPIPDDDVPAFIKRDYVLRPHCLNPSVCAGSSTKHCHSCTKAMAQSEAA